MTHATIRNAAGTPPHRHDVAGARCFGLRIENHLLQVAIATPIDGQRFELQFDEIKCIDGDGWLNTTGRSSLISAIDTLVERHQMRRHPIAVSLDGDFCVTRVTIGTADEVDHELAMLANRIPHYLQLGPGEKVTGVSRRKIEPSVDYAVTGVVNRSLIQLIYDSLRMADIEVAWVEPSLVGVARLVGQAGLWGDRPIMIADGTGKQWDVGIACSGRLLLDYRPANANSEEGLREALDGHISRLKRFCHRHLRGISGELTELLICGDGDKPHRAIEVLGGSLELQPKILTVPELPEIYTIGGQSCEPRYVPAVATIFPLLVNTPAAEVPDLLAQVRRAPDLSWSRQAVQYGWPIAAAVLAMLISYGLVSKERQRHAGSHVGRTELQSEIIASNVKFGRLTRRRELLNHFRTIELQANEPDWNRMLGDVTHSLPESAKLNEFRVESDGVVAMEGTVIDEVIVYELVNTLRRLSSVTQVALKATTPERESQSSRFLIQLLTERTPLSVFRGDHDE